MLGNLKPLYRPGLVHIYHGLTWGPLIREIVSAATGTRHPRRSLPPRSSTRWASAGRTTVWRRQDVPLVAPSHVDRQAAARADRDGVQAPRSAAPRSRSSRTPTRRQFLTGVVPSSNTVSTADELSRFAEILRRGGELDGVRIMSARDPAGRRTNECRRLRPDLAIGLDAAALGHRIHAGLQPVRAVRPQRARRVRAYRPDRHRGVGRPRARSAGGGGQQWQARAAPGGQALSGAAERINSRSRVFSWSVSRRGPFHTGSGAFAESRCSSGGEDQVGGRRRSRYREAGTRRRRT